MTQRNDSITSTPEPPRRSRGPGWLALAVTLALMAALLYWRWPKKSAEEEAEPVVVSVHVAKAERGAIAAQTTALGTIFPKQQATVSAKISAPIVRMALLKNRVVKAGEPIAILESRDLQAQRTEAAAALQEARSNLRNIGSGTIPQATAQAEKDLHDARANVENARATYERRRDLYERGGISRKDLEAAQLALTTAEDQLRLAERTVNLRASALSPSERAQAEAKVKQAEERLAALDAQLSYATIRAPFTGVVTDQFQYRGEFAAAGAKLVNIADLSEVIVKAPFADTVAAHLKTGDAAKVLPTDQPGQELAGRVSLVSRAADPANRSVEVWVTLDNRSGRLRANGSAQVVVATQSVGDAVIVPTSAVTLDASNAAEGRVMVVDSKSIAHETKVSVGIRTPDKVEITSGLKGGETVVTEGNYALPDGAKVQVNEEKEGEGKSEAEDKKDEKPEEKK
ncbi:MAG: efflux RND transporter periplasmic adaptor subunit [Blastocatellia bacterium]